MLIRRRPNAYMTSGMPVYKRLFQWHSALIGAVYATQSFTNNTAPITRQSDLPNANKMQTFWAGKV